MVLLILGLILFISLVIVHEFGHFVAARRGGVEVEEFGVGFPPKVYGKKFKGHKTEYTINLLPLGGFVKLKGEHDNDKGKGSYGSAKLKTKISIMLAGVGMNIIAAWLIFSALAVVGLPQLPLPNNKKQFTVASDTKVSSNTVYIGYVEPESPAEKSGLKSGDKVTGILDPSKCSSADIKDDCVKGVAEASEIRPTVEGILKSGQSKVVLILDERKIEVEPRSLNDVEDSVKQGTPKGYLGIEPVDFTLTKSTWSAPITGAVLTAQFTKITFQGIFGAINNLFAGNASEAGQSVTGPVGIFFVLKQGAELGYQYMLMIIALLSVTLAVMNVLPIPALDGGRLFVTLAYRLFKRPLTAKIEEKIHGTGFIALLGLFLLISIVDIRRFF